MKAGQKTTEQLIDKVWATLDEIAESQKEFREDLKKSKEEFDLSMKKSREDFDRRMEKIERITGSLSNNIGHFAED